MKQIYFGIFALALASSCAPKEKASFSAKPDSVLTKADSNLRIAQQNFALDSSEENYIWLGRRLGYVSRFDDAIAVYTIGLKEISNSFRLYRHRGHRYISLRKFDWAVADLNKAAVLMKGATLEIEPDGIPNKLNKPLSSTQFNVWYHLGLAHFLMGNFEKALDAYNQCLTVSTNDDLKVATYDWLYMTCRRMNDKKAAEKILAQISDSMEIIENDSYYKRLKMYQGKIPPDSLMSVNASSADADLAIATQGYGVGNWYLYNGDTTKAKQIFERVLKGKSKSSFGYIAAEIDLARMK